MAYADKITTLRRFAAITGEGGIIFAEGVNIEGTLVYKLVGNDKVYSMTPEEMDDFLKDKDARLVYQDSDDDDFWEPRTFDSESPYYEKKEHTIPGFENLEESLDKLTIVKTKCRELGCEGGAEYSGYCYFHRSHN